MSFSLSKSQLKRKKLQASPSPRKSIIKQHKIHNNQKLKVFIKFKPQTTISKNNPVCVSYLNQKQLQIQTSLNKKIYQFDHVFDPIIDAQTVFNIGCIDLIEQVIEGVHNKKVNNNGLIFVYGNTGTGKTHTMGLVEEVNQHSNGIVPDALRHIFEDNNSIQQVCISFCEIYKDQVYDLLEFGQQKRLNIRQNQKSKEPYIQDLIMIEVGSFQQASQLINIGLQKRRIAEQKVNKRSSRGHGIITIYMKSRYSQNCGRISFVDLAGCERIKQSQSKGATLNQALHINASLSALQTLLMNISDQNVRSYRSNKLTRLLQPYFQFGKIRLFVTSNYQSTQSIEFAKRCKGIRFHERQVKKQTDNKVFKTPRKHQKTEQKHFEKIENIKKEFLNREKAYVKCISNLMSIINKIYQSTASAVRNQSIHSSFSLPELFQHLPLQSKVNSKINIFQKKQQTILYQDDNQNQFSKISSQISTNMTINEDMDSFMSKTQQVMRNMQEVGFSIVKKIGQISQLAQYKNVYKKQWFTSQIKNGLLENKNCQFQKGISFLFEQLSKVLNQTSGSKQLQGTINRKLKQCGIVFSQQIKSTNLRQSMNVRQSGNDKSIERQFINRMNKTNLSKTNSTNKTPRKLSMARKSDQNNPSNNSYYEHQQIQNTCSNSNRSRKRSLIYIDQE